jgi:RNA polymerase sigma-70 factor (ECF subfamily)
MLTEDATLAMPPSPIRYRGREQIAAFCAAGPARMRWRRHLPTRANGPLAVGCYAWDRRTAAVGACGARRCR